MLAKRRRRSASASLRFCVCVALGCVAAGPETDLTSKRLVRSLDLRTDTIVVTGILFFPLFSFVFVSHIMSFESLTKLSLSQLDSEAKIVEALDNKLSVQNFTKEKQGEFQKLSFELECGNMMNEHGVAGAVIGGTLMVTAIGFGVITGGVGFGFIAAGSLITGVVAGPVFGAYTKKFAKHTMYFLESGEYVGTTVEEANSNQKK